MSQSIKEMKYQLTILYVVGIFCFMTFYSHNKYYDMSRAKADVVLKLSGIYLILMIILSVCLLFGKGNESKKMLKERIDALDIGVAVFLASAALSVAFSGDKYAALWGNEGFGVGAVMLFMLGGVYFFISRNVKFSPIIIWSVIISGYVVFILGVTDGLGLDIFGWKEHMTSPKADFMSTIGNRDWFVGYLAIVMSFAAVCYLNEKKRLFQILYLIYFFLGFVNLYITKSDGNLLVFGCAIPLVYMALKNEEQWKKIWYIVLSFIFAGVAVELMQWIKDIDILGISLLGWALCNYIIYAIGLVAIAAIILSKKIVGLNLGKRWIVFSVAVIVVLFVVVAVNFDKSFGSNRGYIWSYVVNSFSQFDFIHKLFGWGVERCYDAIYMFEGKYIEKTWEEGTRIVNAHNEVLQYMITMGIFGMIAYCGVYVTAIIRCVKNGKHFMQVAAAVAIWAYFCTALGNNPQALNYVIMFCMLAFIRCESLTNDKNGDIV